MYAAANLASSISAGIDRSDVYWSDDRKLCSLHLLVMLVLFSVYGTQVCPLIESLALVQLVPPLALILSLLFVARQAIRPAWFNDRSLADQNQRMFRCDLLCFIVSGIAMAGYNHVVYSAPIDSMLKVIFGFAMFGFYVSSDLLLIRQSRLNDYLSANKENLLIKDAFTPFSHKLVALIISNVTFLSIVAFLVFYKDVEWLMGEGSSYANAVTIVLIEVATIFVVGLGYNVRLVLVFARNLAQSLRLENETLKAVRQGQLTVSVPVTANDEFGQMAELTNHMISCLSARTEELERTQDAAILSLVTLAGARDSETGMHIRRTQHYVRVLAEQLMSHPRFTRQLDTATISNLFKTAPLHDIGKVGIPDRILQKPGKLTVEEFEVMKQHTLLGSAALVEAEQQLGTTSFLRLAREIALNHHERWDGNGYPNGLRGSEIPISARLMALADVYDAVRSKRCYKPARSHEEAKAIIIDGRGTQFDPNVVDAFLATEPEFQAIASQYVDR
ncbi:MAG: HD domain-containing protein [Alphaproteobacteria bacterium]|nr:HD domain-containing protein [Alphaproteobacteria bacterium]